MNERDTTMRFRVRLFEPKDLEKLLPILNTYYLEPQTEESWLAENAQEVAEGNVERQIVAVQDRDGGSGEGERVVGYGSIMREYGQWDRGRLQLWVIVDPAVRGKGAGSLLYDDLLAWAVEHEANKLDSMMRDDDPASLAFAEKRDFRLDRHMYSSRLALAAFEDGKFSDAFEKPEEGGIRFFTMAEIRDTDEAQQKLYDLNKYIDAQIPGERLFPSFEEFRDMVFRSDWYDPAAQVIAADGERWVGMTAGGVFAPDVMTMTITGVHSEYGGRGIGTALKLLLVRYARGAGVTYMMAGNDSHNEPMLRVNEKLGFKKLRGTYYVQRLLGREAE